PPESSSSPRVLQRTAVPLPIIKADQSLAAGRDGSGLGIENFENISSRSLRLGRLDAGKMLPVPVENGPGGSLASLQGVDPFDDRIRIAAEHSAAEKPRRRHGQVAGA